MPWLSKKEMERLKKLEARITLMEQTLGFPSWQQGISIYANNPSLRYYKEELSVYTILTAMVSHLGMVKDVTPATSKFLFKDTK